MGPAGSIRVSDAAAFERPADAVRRPRDHARATLRYAALWTAGSAVVVLAAVLVLRTFDPAMRHRVPPTLGALARAAGCHLARVERRDALAGALPAVGGRDASGSAPRPGVYVKTAPAPLQQLRALRRGYVVLHYRATLAGAAVGAVFGLYREDRRRTFVVEHPRLPVAVAATAWRRRLTCPVLDAPAATALRAFRLQFAALTSRDGEPRTR